MTRSVTPCEFIFVKITTLPSIENTTRSNQGGDKILEIYQKLFVSVLTKLENYQYMHTLISFKSFKIFFSSFKKGMRRYKKCRGTRE